MKNFRVTFTQNWVYDVEAKNEDDAHEIAEKDFHAEMRRPVAHTMYDECEIEELEPDKDDDDCDDYD